MKPKSFKDYLAKRLDQSEIVELEKQADIELEAIKLLQDDISSAIANYMAQEKIGFNELVRRLGVSSAQAAKIQKGEANLTLASLAHIAALFKRKPHIVFD
jgi:transcriptional regulator with XRE-family HTH domain